MKSLPLALVAAVLAACPAAASEPPVLAVKPLHSGTIASASKLSVPVAGSEPVPVKTLADTVFVDPRARSAEIRGARRALFAEPVSEERFVETEDSTTFETTLTFTVTDPELLRSSSPRFRKHQAAIHGKGDLSVATMTPSVRKEYDAFKADMLKKPDGHPMKEAARKGDDALLDAVAAGKGDIVITTSLVLPKKRIPVDGKQASVPAMTDAGLDYAKPEARTFTKIPSNTGLVAGKPIAVVDPLPDLSPTLDGTGKRTQTRDFLTGFTEYQSFDWSERWSFGKHDYFKIGAHAGYAFGLRAPVQITGVMEPTKFSKKSNVDLPADYSVTVTGKPINGSESYYKELGLSNGEAADGHEFVLEADAYASVDLEAGWGIISIHQRIPSNLGIDWGQDFVPPYDSCGSNCGIDLWVPASITHTVISLLGIVTGSAQIGVKLGGTGTVAIDYLSLEAGTGIESRKGGTKAMTQHLTFQDPSHGSKLVTTLPALTSPGTKEFGYRLSNPEYTWNLTVTPGIKGGIDINAKPFFSEEIDIGPFWLGAAAMKLGSFELGAHDGTPRSYELQPGEKSFIQAQSVLDGTLTPKTAYQPSSATMKPIETSESKPKGKGKHKGKSP